MLLLLFSLNLAVSVPPPPPPPPVGPAFTGWAAGGGGWGPGGMGKADNLQFEQNQLLLAVAALVASGEIT